MPVPCPHCGLAIRQANVYGLCAGCGKLLPAELRAPPVPPAGGAFSSGDYRFQIVENAHGIRGLRKELIEDEFDRSLSQSGKIPKLAGAPVASWMLARVATLTSAKLGFPLNDKQRNDGGGFAIDFVVYTHDTRPIAEFQIAGDTMGAALLGRCTDDCSPNDILKCLVAAMLTAPTELTPCTLAVIDPEWKEDPECYTPRPVRGSKNWYGWDGTRFLGEKNIRDTWEPRTG